MKTIRNKTRTPLRVPLGAGKVLHLGPDKTGEVADASAERDAFVKLVDAGTIEIVHEGGSTGRSSERGNAPAESTHGRASARTQRTGDR